MKHVLRWILPAVVLAGVVLALTSSRPTQAAPTPYASVLTDLGTNRGQHRTCDNARCVRADISPIGCDPMPDENCRCNIPGPSGCGNPGASCGQIDLCE